MYENILINEAFRKSFNGGGISGKKVPVREV